MLSPLLYALIFCPFSLLYNIPLGKCVRTYLSILLLRAIWVAPGLGGVMNSAGLPRWC